MRRIVLATAATFAILTAGSLAPNRVGAMTVTIPTGLQAAIDTTTLLEDVAVVCRRVCGVYAVCRDAGGLRLITATTVATAITAAAPTITVATTGPGGLGGCGKLSDARQRAV